MARSSRNPRKLESRFPLIKRPPRATLENLSAHRVPVHYLHAGLSMHKDICQQTQRIMQELAIRHLDFSISYWNQPQGDLDFFKREVLLNPDLGHLTRYEDGWPIDVLLRLLFRRRAALQGLQTLVPEAQRRQHVNYHLRRRSPTTRLSAPTIKENQPEVNIDDSEAVTTTSRLTVLSALLESATSSAPAFKENQLEVNIGDSEALTATSRLTVLSTLLGSVTPNLGRFYPAITEAGLSTDDHLDHFLRLTATSKERFIKSALADDATSFEQVAVMEVLEQIKRM